MIKLMNITKKYKDFLALDDVSLSISKGEFIALVGLSGSGKSTLLNIIGQIDNQTTGSLFIDAVDTNYLKDIERSKLRLTQFGFIFQSFYLEANYTVYHNIEIPLIINDIKKEARKIRIDELLRLVNLTEKKDNKAVNLSGGEQQRVAIARALANDPAIILADEPCGNLDTTNSEVVLNILKELNHQGKTVIMVTHEMNHAKIAKRIIKLSDGRIISDEKNT